MSLSQFRRSETGLAPPAMSALALTVGALVADREQGVRPARESVAVLPVGLRGTPSRVSRKGTGIGHAIKPELCAPGGTSSRLRPTLNLDRYTLAYHEPFLMAI